MISISKVSELTGVTVKTLKIWDNEGNLKAKYKTARMYGARGGRKIKKDIEKSIKELSIEESENSENNTESNIDK